MRAAGLGLLLTAACAGPAQACAGCSTARAHAYLDPWFLPLGDGCFNGGGARAHGVAAGSPGVLSGDVVQIPVSAPISVCGDSIALPPSVGDGGGTGGGGGNDGGGSGGNS